MPNRMLRDWTQSDKVDEVSCEAERFFTRLIMQVDDYGCFYADSRLLKANLFPLKLDKVREADMSRWMAECQKAGLIVLYEVNQKRYLQILEFRQRLDKAKAKFPLPTDSTESVEIVNDFPAEESRNTKQNTKQNTPTADPPLLVFPFDSDDFKKNWQHWKDYKKSEHRFNYKSAQSEQSSLEDLVKKSKGLEETAIAIIRQSMANGWKGFFELKKDFTNGHSKTRQSASEVSTSSAFDKIDRMSD